MAKSLLSDNHIGKSKEVENEINNTKSMISTIVGIDGENISTTAPESPVSGDKWFNPDTGETKIYNDFNDTWETSSSGGTNVSSTEPPSPNAGDKWFNPDNGEFGIYINGSWEVIAVISEVESISQNKADTAESNANNYTDNKLNNYEIQKNGTDDFGIINFTT